MGVLLVAGLAFVVSAGLIRFVLLSPRVRNRIVAAPVVHRWHETPTPSYGGIPMFVAVVVAVIIGGGLGEPIAVAILVGAGVLFVTGLVDDIYDISPMTKLAGQVLGAVATVALAATSLELGLFAAAVIAGWLVLMANSVNLLDNMDGLAGGTSLVSLLVVLPIVVAAGFDGLTLVVAAVAGAVAGFLVAAYFLISRRIRYARGETHLIMPLLAEKGETPFPMFFFQHAPRFIVGVARVNDER